MNSKLAAIFKIPAALVQNTVHRSLLTSDQCEYEWQSNPKYLLPSSTHCNRQIIVSYCCRSTGVSANDGQWHQICATWENVNGEWKLYKDGKMVKTGTGFKKGYVIEAEGSLVLGQEQDIPGGKFQEIQSFQGSLTNVNVWSHVLPESTIKELSGCCRAGEGNVYMWSDFIYAIKGNPHLVIPPTCKCVY